MAFLQVNYYSSVLQIQTAMNVILPQQSSWKPLVGPPYQTLYLLHGLAEDHSVWQRFTSIERYAEKYNLAVIMPYTARGFYTDIRNGPMWWTHISQELPRICGEMFPLSQRREDTFAAGASMGGYGALKLGLRRPELFSAVAGMSGAYLGAEFEGIVPEGAYSDERREEMEAIFGATFRQGDDSFQNLLEASKRPLRPDLFLCCGGKDSLYSVNAAFRDRARALGMNVKWSEADEASHTWSYWDRMIPDVLRWLPLQKAMKL